MHHLIKSSQKATKGRKYYYSTLSLRMVRYLSFPRSAANEEKSQDSNRHLCAKFILFATAAAWGGGGSRKGFMWIRAWQVRDVIQLLVRENRAENGLVFFPKGILLQGSTL